MRQAGLSGLIAKKWRAHHDPRSRRPGRRRPRSTATSPPAPRTGCWVADITYLRTWEGWLYLVAVQDLYSPPDRRLGDGRSHAHRARHRRAADGARAPPARPRADLALRSGQPVRQPGLRPAGPRRRHRAVDGQPRRLLRQRRRRELLRDAQEGAHPPPHLADRRPSCAPRSSTTSRSSTTASAATAPSASSRRGLREQHSQLDGPSLAASRLASLETMNITTPTPIAVPNQTVSTETGELHSDPPGTTP